MSNNQIPSAKKDFTALAGKMTVGLTALGTVLEITQITAATMQADLDAYMNAGTSFNLARSARLAMYEVYHTRIDELYVWLGRVSGVLTGFFGFRWSNQWAQAGYVNNSTAIPSSINGRTALTQELVAFFTADPNYQAPQLTVTAAVGAAQLAAVLNAQAAAVTSDANLAAAGQARAEAREALATQMRMLIRILQGLLAPDDVRWLAFGLNMPGTDTTPGEPLNFTAEVMSDFTIMAECDPVPRATRYRWRMKVEGVETEFSLAASTVAPLAIIASIEPGQTVELYVQAVNGNAQGVPSETVTLTLNAPPAALAARAAAQEISAPVESNGEPSGHAKNGHRGNGATVKAAR